VDVKGARYATAAAGTSVKGWLARATASTVRRGPGHTRVARWSRWFPRAGPVCDGLFQGAGDPYPGHWRRSPEPWPAGFADGDFGHRELRRGLGELPPSWRCVIYLRDVAGRDAASVAAELGLTAGQEQQILNQARAALCAALSRRAGQDPR
jgi:RNA polymerase sigma-70 factor, ECF subfamily